jgi:hypothetical protein
MLGLINALVELLFDILEGLVQFLRDLIPLLLKLVFALSPFLLSVGVAYLYGGTRLGIIIAGIVVVLMVVGLVYAYRRQIAGTGLSNGVIIAVIIVDISLVVLTGFKTSWFGLRRISTTDIQTSSSVPPASQNADPRSTREGLLLDLLKKSIQDDNYGETVRAIDGLVSIKSKASIPIVIDALRRYYPRAVSSSSESDYAYRTSVECMWALEQLEASESCVLLAEIAVKNPVLTTAADAKSQTLCK